MLNFINFKELNLNEVFGIFGKYFFVMMGFKNPSGHLEENVH